MKILFITTVLSFAALAWAALAAFQHIRRASGRSLPAEASAGRRTRLNVSSR